MLKFDQLPVALAAAKQQLDLILKKYPYLEDRLVLSLPCGQTGIDPSGIAKEYRPKGIDYGDWGSPGRFMQYATQLNPDEKYQIEIHFNGREYDLNWKLQVDDLLDRNLTPQTTAFLRLSLGPFDWMMDTLAEIHSEYEKSRKSHEPQNLPAATPQ
jgi:hypothetical protein